MRQPVVVALVVGLAIRVATLPLPGNDDVIAWKMWTYSASHDVTAMYGVGGTPTTRGVVTWGGVLVAVAVATKPRGLLVGPAFALVLWQRGGVAALARAGTSLLASVGLLLVPSALRGAMANMWLAFGSFSQRRDTLSAFAANVGWMVNWLLRSWQGAPQRGWRAFLQVVPRPLAISRFRLIGGAEGVGGGRR